MTANDSSAVNDPEYEMPDPDRPRRGRYQSEAYRHNFGDSRYGYRWNPDRIEQRYRGEHLGRLYDDAMRWRALQNERARWEDRYEPPYSFDRFPDYEDWDDSRTWERDRGWPDDERDRWGRRRY